MTRQQTIQLILVLAFVGFSVISWLVKQLQEQAKKKRIRDEIERRELELLRTGRDTAAAEPPPPPPITIPARRRLEDVLRERLERQAGGAGVPSPIPRPIPREAQAPRQRPQQPQRAPASAPDPNRPKRKQKVQKVQAIPGSPLVPDATTVIVPARAALASDRRSGPAISPASIPAANLPTWQRAFVLGELLAPPLSIRPGSP